MSELRHENVRLAADTLPGKRVAVVGLAALVFGLLLVYVAWLLMHAFRGDQALGPPATPPETAPARLGGVLQTPLPGGAGLELFREEAVTLERWGWADRERQLVRLPLEIAVERLLAGETPSGLPLETGAPLPPLPDVGSDPRGATGRVRGGHPDTRPAGRSAP